MCSARGMNIYLQSSCCFNSQWGMKRCITWPNIYGMKFKSHDQIECLRAGCIRTQWLRGRGFSSSVNEDLPLLARSQKDVIHYNELKIKLEQISTPVLNAQYSWEEKINDSARSTWQYTLNMTVHAQHDSARSTWQYTLNMTVHAQQRRQHHRHR